MSSSAVPNYASVSDVESVVNPVLDKFGKVDILINNAGILRDKNLLRVTDEDWDAIIDIHLTAPFKLTRKLFPIMKDQKYGKIINTSRFESYPSFIKKTCMVVEICI